MGVSTSTPMAKRSKEIDRQLRAESVSAASEIKLLLLGAGESGKSTVVKQMQIIHMRGFGSDDRAQYKPLIYSNTIDAMATIIAAMPTLYIDFGSGDHTHEDASIIRQLAGSINSEDEDRFSSETLRALKRLWADTGVRQCLERSNEYQINDSAAYLFDSLDRIGAANYEPSDQDILRARQVTFGISEVSFLLKGLNFRLFDVGGQRSERRKWIHYFEGVTAILFITALSEYDQVLREDGVTNRMHESLKLFETIRTSKWFVKTSIILFLNKRDLFEEKISKRHSPLTKCFPEYTGAAESYAETSRYVSDKFNTINDQSGQPFYSHLTCATDTENINVVFDSASDVITGNLLKNAGFA